MVQGKNFCTNCGAPMAPGIKFCGNCGQQVGMAAAPPAAAYSPAPPPPPAPVQAPPTAAVQAEPILGIIPAISRKKGLMGVEGFNAVVTNKRLIFAIMTNDMIKEAAKQAGKEGGFLAGMLGAATAGYTFYKRYLTMEPEAALRENQQNFAIDISRIRKVKVFAGREIKNYHTMKANMNSFIKVHQHEKGKLEIETVGDKLNFDVPMTSMNQTLDALDKAGLI